MKLLRCRSRQTKEFLLRRKRNWKEQKQRVALSFGKWVINTTEPGIRKPLFTTSQEKLGYDSQNRLNYAAISEERVFLNFAKAPEMHMLNSDRKVPIQLLDQMIKWLSAKTIDPRRLSGADMYYSQIWKNGKLYNIEVLYSSSKNKIEHFKYARDSMGPLKRISKQE